MATTNQHPGLTVDRKPTGHDVSIDEKPTLPAPPMRRKSRLVVLSCLLAVTAGSAGMAQWMKPQVVAAEARREEHARHSFTVQEKRAEPVAAGLALDADPPHEQEGLTSAEVEYQTIRTEPQRQHKVRESDALVRDGRRLLMQHPALAEKLFEVAIAIDARNPHAHAGHAHALRRLHKPLEARVALEQALRIRPKRARYHALLAVLDRESAQVADERTKEPGRRN